MRKYESHGFFADPCDVCTITCIYMNVTFPAHCAQVGIPSRIMSLLGSAATWVMNALSSLVGQQATSPVSSSPQLVTLQVEALSVVHNYYADKEKKDLKRKLEATQKDLATMRDQLTELAATASEYTDAVESEHKRSRRWIDRVELELQAGRVTGLTLSPTEVQDLMFDVRLARIDEDL